MKGYTQCQPSTTHRHSPRLQLVNCTLGHAVVFRGVEWSEGCMAGTSGRTGEGKAASEGVDGAAKAGCRAAKPRTR